MNAIFNFSHRRCFLRAKWIALLFFGVCFEVVGQAPPSASFFSLVNAVDLPTNTIVSVDGTALRKDGLKPGKVTGGLGFPTGTHRIDTTNGDCKPGSLSLQLMESSSPIVIIYLVETKATSGQTTRELKLFARGNAPATNKKAFSVIYAGNSPLQTIVVNGQTKMLRPVTEVGMGEAASLAISQNGQSIATLNADMEGSYLAILYDTRNLRLAALLAEDIVFKRAGQR